MLFGLHRVTLSTPHHFCLLDFRACVCVWVGGWETTNSQQVAQMTDDCSCARAVCVRLGVCVHVCVLSRHLCVCF